MNSVVFHKRALLSHLPPIPPPIGQEQGGYCGTWPRVVLSRIVRLLWCYDFVPQNTLIRISVIIFLNTRASGDTTWITTGCNKKGNRTLECLNMLSIWTTDWNTSFKRKTVDESWQSRNLDGSPRLSQHNILYFTVLKWKHSQNNHLLFFGVKL